jgi:hydrogenase/urease accessory protein HupE
MNPAALVAILFVPLVFVMVMLGGFVMEPVGVNVG